MQNNLVHQDLQKEYDDYYLNGTQASRQYSAIGKINNILKLCADLPNHKVCEIGAGEGAVLEKLSEKNFAENLYALEISKSAISVIKERKIKNVVECKLFDGYTIDYPDKFFDLTILTHVVEHVEHTRLLLKEVARVSKHVFIEVPLEYTLFIKKDALINQEHHVNFYSAKSLHWLVKSCGYHIIKQIITNPSRIRYEPNASVIRRHLYYFKAILLKLIPTIAQQIFTYYSAIICQIDESINQSE